MTLAYITGSGNGEIEYRLVIEGFDYQFVTNEGMERDSSLIKRRVGLLREGLTISEEVIMPEGRLEAQGMSFTIADVDGEATKAFVRRPSRETRLRATVLSNSTDIYVEDVSGFTSGDLIHIGTETIRIVNVLSGSEHRFAISLRGQNDSIPQTHWVSTEFGGELRPLVTSEPFSMERRRIYLYAYGEGDDLQGDGEIIWRGVALTEPSSEGPSYTFSAGPITELLQTEVGGGGGKAVIRGIYHPSAYPFQGLFELMSGDSTVDTAATVSATASFKIEGHYPDKWTMIEEIRNQLIFSSSTWPSPLNATFDAEGRFAVTFTPDSSKRAVRCVFLEGLVDGGGIDTIEEETLVRIGMRWSGFPFYLVQPGNRIETREGRGEAGAHVTVTTSMPGRQCAYVCKVPYPEQLLGMYNHVSINDPYPAQRAYLDTPVLPSLFSTVQIYTKDGEFPFGHGGPGLLGIEGSLQRDDTNRAISGTVGMNRMIFRNDDHYFLVGQEIAVSASVYDFMARLVSVSPNYANQGTMPFVTDRDVDLPSMSATIATVPNRGFYKDRVYAFYEKGAKLEDILAEELKIIACMPATTEEGKLTFKPFRFASAREISTFTATADEVLTDVSYPVRTPNKDGIFNSVTLKTGYNALSEEHEGPTFVLNYIDSIAMLNGRKKSYEIAPYSYQPGLEIDGDLLEEVLLKPVSIFGIPYAVLSFDAPMKLFKATIGKTVSITNAQLPNPATRTRGVTSLTGIVVGRSWDLATGFGRVSILTSDLDLRGYSPTAVVGGGTEVQTGIWDLSISQSHFAPPGQNDADYFSVGDWVWLLEWDPIGATADSGSATITAIPNATTIRVSVHAPFGWFTGSANQHRLIYHNSASVQTSQHDYCFVYSGSNLGGSDVPAPGAPLFGP